MPTTSTPGRPLQTIPLFAAALIFFISILSLAGCSSKTVTETVPPRVDLKNFPVIGMVGFVGTPDNLGQDSTQKFMSRVQASQTGLRLLELGPLEQVLGAIGHNELDHQAIKAIGRKYGVAAVFTGTVSFSEVRPDLKVSPNLTSLSAQAKIDGRMSSKLWDTANGATIWTNSSWGSWSVAGVSLTSMGATGVTLSTPAEQRDRILMELIRALDRDFWPTYVKKRV
jgi:hypothetical protein